MKRALAAGELIRIHRGLYCLGSRYRDRPIDALAVAQRIMGPSYVSLEAALAFHGWLPGAVETVASVCDARSRSFHALMVPERCRSVALNYRSRRVQQFLEGLSREVHACRSC